MNRAANRHLFTEISPRPAMCRGLCWVKPLKEECPNHARADSLCDGRYARNAVGGRVPGDWMGEGNDPEFALETRVTLTVCVT